MITAQDVDEVGEKIRARAASGFMYFALDMPQFALHVTLVDKFMIEAYGHTITEMLQDAVDKINAHREG